MSDLIVYTARKIHTMEPSQPVGQAIAVRDGAILEIGTLESLKPWLERYPHKIDTTFEEKIILPGFIDPHLHPSMASVILPMQFITALEWKLPWGPRRLSARAKPIWKLSPPMRASRMTRHFSHGAITETGTATSHAPTLMRYARTGRLLSGIDHSTKSL